MDTHRLNPVTLITGAASGLGALCAHALARRSEGGLILIDADETQLSLVADAIAKPPERVSTLAFDVTDGERWTMAADFIRSQYGRLDWAIIDTSTAHTALLDLSKKDARRVTAANLDTAFLSLRTLMPLIAENSSGGGIVIAASAASLKGEPGASGASKAGLLQVTRVAAKEGAPNSIRINAIATDGAEPALWRKAPLFQDLIRETGSDRAALEKVARLSAPFARYGGGDDVTRLVSLLLSDAASITGATLVVDAGYTL